MTTQKQIMLTTLLVLYLVTTATTNFSLIGFWTDIVVSVGFIAFALKSVYTNKTNTIWLTITLRSTTVICAILMSPFLLGSVVFSFGWDFSKLRSFYLVRVEGRYFNAYFKPVGSYSGGEGNFWITESPILFPLIEKEVYYKHAILDNFNDDTWEGKPINNYEVVKSYIKDEVIDKQR